MWSCQNRGAQWPARHSPWELGASARRLQALSRAPWESPAAFQARTGQNRPARSIPAWRERHGGRGGPGVERVPARRVASLGEALAVVPVLGAPSAEPGAAGPALPAAARPRRRESAEPADSKGVPGQFCLWIPKYWVRVLNVFSSSLGHLLYVYPNTILAVGAANPALFGNPSSRSRWPEVGATIRER